MNDLIPPRPSEGSGNHPFPPLVDAQARLADAKVRQDQIQSSLEVAKALEKAEVSRIRSQATVASTMAFLAVWFALWFAAAIAVAGLRTAQYLWQYWPLGF